MRGVRWEVGLSAQDKISEQFDPMIAKLVVTDSDRESASFQMIQALHQTFIAGPKTNCEFLCGILAHEDFLRPGFGTKFIETHLQVLLLDQKQKHERDHSALDAISAFVRHLHGGHSVAAMGHSVQQITAQAFSRPTTTGSDLNVAAGNNLKNRKSSPKCSLLSTSYLTLDRENIHRGQGHYNSVTGKNQVFWYALIKSNQHNHLHVLFNGYCHFFSEKVNEQWVGQDEASAGKGGLQAPVPGRIINIYCQPGDHVKKGEKLFVLESMKMQYEVQATEDGVIGQVLFTEGQRVEAGQALAAWAAE